MSFELIEAEEAHYPKALMCRALGLSRSGHHAYSTRGPSRRALEEQQLDVLVAAIFAELGGRYGAPRIQQELRRRGHRTSRKRVAASMARQGLRARPRRRWRRTTDSTHREPIAANLLERNFTAEAPDRAWVADTTYLPCSAGSSSSSSSSTCSPARSSAGRWATGSMQSCRAKRCGARWRGASQVRGSSSTPTAHRVRGEELPRVARPHRRGAEHEPQGQLLGQRGGGELSSPRWSSRWRLALPGEGLPTPSMGCSTSSRATTTRGGCTPTTTSRVQTKPKPAGAHARWQHNLGVHETGASPVPCAIISRSVARSASS